MNHVYILNDNNDSSFTSLIMNEVSGRGLGFSDIRSTKIINHDKNVLIYIPKVGEPNSIFRSLDEYGKHRLFNFKNIFILTTCKEDHEYVKSATGVVFNSKKFRFYQTLNFDTVVTRILVNDCSRVFTRFSKRL